MPGKDPGGVIVTILIGIVGAVIGRFLGRTLFSSGSVEGVPEPGFLISLAMAIVGAITLLAVYRLSTGRTLRA